MSSFQVADFHFYSVLLLNVAFNVYFRMFLFSGSNDASKIFEKLHNSLNIDLGFPHSCTSVFLPLNLFKKILEYHASTSFLEYRARWAKKCHCELRIAFLKACISNDVIPDFFEVSRPNQRLL